MNRIPAEEKIRHAARSVFQSKGLHGARMQDIADKAGINKALLHYYFRSKEQLFEAVFREAFQQLFSNFEIISSNLPFAEKIEKFVQGYIDILLLHPFLPGFVIHEINQDPARFEQVFLPAGATAKFKNVLSIMGTELKKNGYAGVDARQFMVNIISLCIFPFVAKPMICKIMGIKEQEFKKFIANRKKLIPSLVIQSLARP